MTTAQQSSNGHKVFPSPCSVENPDESNRGDLPTNKANPNSNSAAKDDRVVERQKGVPITPLLAHEKVSIDTDPLPDRCQFADPTRSSGESHQQDELSPVNKVVPSDKRERGISPEPLPDRCQFTFSDGRQCSMARSDIHPSLCRFHAEREDQLFGSPSPGGHVVGAALDLPELHSACRDLTTAAGVNRALAQVFRLLAQRRISRQEAATFGHLAQLLLRTISLMRAEATASASENKQPMIPEPATAVNSSSEPEIPAAACELTPIPRTPSPASTQEPFAAPNPVPRNPRTINTSAAFVSNSSEINTSEGNNILE